MVQIQGVGKRRPPETGGRRKTYAAAGRWCPNTEVGALGEPGTTITIPQVELGRTGLRVSKLGFGTYDFGVRSNHINPEEGGRILAGAFDLGVRFWDTSDDYGSHPHVASALERVPRKEVVISTKTSAHSAGVATRSLERSLRELGTDYVDLFFLHYVKADWIDGCRGVLKDLVAAKASGRARAVGLSTHSVKVAREAATLEAADVVLAVCSTAREAVLRRLPENVPLEDGSMEEMLDAVRALHAAGKGTVAMKVLGTGAPALVQDYRRSIGSVSRLDFVDALLVGMKDLDQVVRNVAALGV